MIGSFPNYLPWENRPDFSNIKQKFTWEGGDLYYRYSIRAMGGSSYVRNVPYTIYLSNNNKYQHYYFGDELGIPNENLDTPGDNQYRDYTGTKSMLA